MGKSGKKGKESLADRKAQRVIEKKRKQDVDQRAVNPFERRRVKKHHQVLGQRMKSAELDMGQARSKAQELRRHTLQLEHDQDGKRNAFVDRRIGENEEALTEDEKMLIRFQKERQKQLGKAQQSIFNLEEEGLTHYGQSLADADYSFDVDSDDEDNKHGISDEMVDEYHFGGGLFKKVVDESTGGVPTHKSRDEVMKEIIAKSKFYKAVHAKEKREASDMTDALDDEFDSAIHLMPKRMTEDERDEAKGSMDEFDLTVKELAYEARAKATDRMLTKEEIARKQRERLEFLESERVKRMTQEVDSDGEEAVEKAGESDDDGEGLEGDLDGNLDFDSDGERGDDSDDDEEQKAPIPAALSESEKLLIEQNIGNNAMPFVMAAPSSYEEFAMLAEKYASGQSAGKLSELLARIFTSNSVSLGPSYRKSMERMLVVLVQYFGRTANKHAGRQQFPTELLDVLSIAITRLAHDVPQQATLVAKKKLQAMDAALVKHMAGGEEHEKTPYCWRVADLMFVKLIANIFSVSDFQHSVITPALILLSSYLSFVPVTSGGHVVTKLFSCSLVLHLVKPAKRYAPEAIQVIYSILLAATATLEEDAASLDESLSPAERQHLNSIVCLPRKAPANISAAEAIAPLDVALLLGKKPSAKRFRTPAFKYQVFVAALGLLEQFSNLYFELPAHPEIFSCMVAFLAKCKRIELPESVAAVVRRVRRTVRGQVKEKIASRDPLQYADNKPVALRGLEPDFIDGYNPTKDYELDRDLAEQKKLKKKLKEETKGAMRELRKDNQFLENMRLQKVLDADRERQEKLKEIMGSLQREQHQIKEDNKKSKSLL